MKKILAILPFAALLFAACDKIEPGDNGEYTIFAGATASWMDGTAIANPVHRALVEKYTGPKCVNCPTADIILTEAHERIGDQMVILAITPGGGDGLPYTGQPDVSTEDGDQWAMAYGGSVNMSLPFVIVDRVKTETNTFSGANTMSGVENVVNSIIAQEAVAALEVSATSAADSTVTINVNVNYLQDCDSALSLTLALMEDSLVYYQAGTPTNGGSLQPEYRHNHMLRDVITDVWGIDIQAEGRAGEARKARFSYTLPNGVVKDNCHIVAFISNKDSRRVVNCAECKIDE